MPLVRRTRATLRSAEFGFFGVVVYTRVQTPRRCGAPRRAGVLVFDRFDDRPLRTSWAMVGTRTSFGIRNDGARRCRRTRGEAIVRPGQDTGKTDPAVPREPQTQFATRRDRRVPRAVDQGQIRVVPR